MEQPLPDFSQLKDQIWEEVRRAIRLSNHTEGFWENVQSFVHAVDWKVGLSVFMGQGRTLTACMAAPR
jgi:hypothetical protein